MVVFKLDSNSIFIRCADKLKIDAYELDATTTSFSSSSAIKATEWKHLVTIGPDLDYDALEIFGVEINGLIFNNLAEELCHFRLIVNREGYCYLNTGAIIDPSFGVPYYRLNDLFSWSKYGIEPNFTSIWNRCDIISGGSLINFEDQYNILKKFEQDFKMKEEELCLYKEEISALKIELEKCQDEKSNTNPNDSLPPPPLPLPPLPPPPPIRFYISQSPLPTHYDITWILRKFNVVDEDVTGLFPRNVNVYANDGQFDSNNWRFVRGEENSRIYMVAFYGGEIGQVEFHKGDIVNVPFNRGVAILADVHFFVAMISGIGFRFAFLY